MRNTFSVSRTLSLAMLVISCSTSLPVIGRETQTVALPLDGAVPTEALVVNGAVKVAELRPSHAPTQLRHVFRMYSIASGTGDGQWRLLLTNRRSRTGNGAGYCGAGHELELHLVSVAGPIRILDTSVLEGCLAGEEILREIGLTVMSDGIEYRRFCDPSDVIVRLAWEAGKFKRSFVWAMSDPNLRLSALIQRSSLPKRRADIPDVRTRDGSELSNLLAGASAVRTLMKWHQPKENVTAIEVTTTPADGRGDERHVLVIGEDVDGHAHLRQFIEVSRFGEDMRVAMRELAVGGTTLLFPLKCGNEMATLILRGGQLQFQ